MYYRAKIPAKTILCFIELGVSDKILPYCQSFDAFDYAPDWASIVSNVYRLKPLQCVTFAIRLLDGNILSATEILDILGPLDAESGMELANAFQQASDPNEVD